MATYNVTTKKRNPQNTGWDTILPITVADNVLVNDTTSVGDFLKNIDTAPTGGSTNLITSGAVKAALDKKAESTHKHTKADITDFPTSLPANGGNAATVGGFTVGTNVPSNAKFTDTVYSHPTSGVSAGTYRSVTVNAQGHVTRGTNPTTLAGYGITDALSSVNPTTTGTFTHGDRQPTAQVGAGSVVMGSECISSGMYSFAGGLDSTASANYAFAFGSNASATNFNTVAFGDSTVAKGIFGFVNGTNSTAGGFCSTAFGEDSSALGSYSFVAGCSAIATAPSSAVFGESCDTNANGECGLVAGSGCQVGGYAGLAIGNVATSYATAAGAIGYDVSATNIGSLAIGTFNSAMTTGGAIGNQTGDAFVIGNGTGGTTKSNAFRVTRSGLTYSKGAYNTSGADYAEYFEWEDGNPNGEDRRGYFVTMEGAKIKIADSNSNFILGIVSGNPCIIGNSDEDWSRKWVVDEFNTPITKKVVTALTKKVRNAETKEFEYIETGEVVEGTAFVENPEYDPSLEYIERKDRKEWSAIGMMGVISVRDNGECNVNSFCTVGDGGIAVPSETGYRVIERISDNIIKVVFR